MKTKEQILDETPHSSEYPDYIHEWQVCEVMEKYAKQQAVEFCQDVLDNIEINGVKLLTYKKVNAAELYEIWHEED